MKIDITPNEYRFRIHNPSIFHKKSFRIKDIGKGIKLVVGKYKSQPITAKTKVQSIHFSKNKWTLYNAKKWIMSHRIGKSLSYSLQETDLTVDFFR